MTKSKTIEQLRAEKERAETQLLQEQHSLTVRGNKWFRHSQSKGGYPIDFVMEFYGNCLPLSGSP